MLQFSAQSYVMKYYFWPIALIAVLLTSSCENKEQIKAEAAAAAAAEAERLAALNVQIEDDCTVNGNGKVTCTFTNSGTGTGSLCVVPFFKRIFSGKFLKGSYKYSYYDVDADAEYMEIIASGEICSGLVRGGDVVDRTKQLGFTVGCVPGSFLCRDPSPAKFCAHPDRRRPWHSGCQFGTRKVSG